MSRKVPYLVVPEFSFPDTVKNRFYSRVKLPNKKGCMEWVGRTIHHGGYGQFSKHGKIPVTAHRYSYELYFGKIPEEMCILHKCDNPPCVSPKHLFLGTQKDNAIDMRTKKRGFSTAGENHGLHTLSLEEVREIRRLYTGKRGEQTQLSLKFKVSKATVHNIVNNKAWRDL